LKANNSSADDRQRLQDVWALLGLKSSPFSPKTVALVATVEFRFWPLADVPLVVTNIRFWG
jgi:hypothetical protein